MRVPKKQRPRFGDRGRWTNQHPGMGCGWVGIGRWCEYEYIEVMRLHIEQTKNIVSTGDELCFHHVCALAKLNKKQNINI